MCLEERKFAWENERRTVGKFEQLGKAKEYRRENTSAGWLQGHSLQVVVQDLDKAYQAFFRRVKASEKADYPSPK